MDQPEKGKNILLILLFAYFLEWNHLVIDKSIRGLQVVNNEKERTGKLYSDISGTLLMPFDKESISKH
jgi:hypothetical protein